MQDNPSPPAPAPPARSPTSSSPEPDSTLLDAPEVLAPEAPDLESQRPTQPTQPTRPTDPNYPPSELRSRNILIIWPLALFSGVGVTSGICSGEWINASLLAGYFWAILPFVICVGITCGHRHPRYQRGLQIRFSPLAVDLILCLMGLLIGLWYTTPYHRSCCPLNKWQAAKAEAEAQAKTVEAVEADGEALAKKAMVQAIRVAISSLKDRVSSFAASGVASASASESESESASTALTSVLSGTASTPTSVAAAAASATSLATVSAADFATAAATASVTMASAALASLASGIQGVANSSALQTGTGT